MTHRPCTTLLHWFFLTSQSYVQVKWFQFRTVLRTRLRYCVPKNGFSSAWMTRLTFRSSLSQRSAAQPRYVVAIKSCKKTLSTKSLLVRVELEFLLQKFFLCIDVKASADAWKLVCNYEWQPFFRWSLFSGTANSLVQCSVQYFKVTWSGKYNLII